MTMRSIANRCLASMLLMMPLFGGCALWFRSDIIGKDGGLYARPYYSVYVDCMVIYHGEWVQGTKSNVFRVLFLLDLPLSIAVDTFLLPMDIVLWIVRDRPEQKRDKGNGPEDKKT